MDAQAPSNIVIKQQAVSRPEGWPIHFQWLRSPPHWFAAPASAVLLVAGFSLVLLSLIAIARLGAELFSDDNKLAIEAIKVLLPLAAAAVGLPLIIWRLAILTRQTKTAEEKTQIDRETHYTTIFSKSVEQLGATREHKEAYEGAGKADARTVPSIEIRLGGIHSLSRLADESARDAPKVENILLSFVRENSWYTRDGVRSSLPPQRYPETYPDWSYYYRAGNITESVTKDYYDWYTEIEARTDNIKKWSRKAIETRVDVSEAISSLSKLSMPIGSGSNFTECLFVGRIITSNLLNKFSFTRCIFVRCRFIIEDIKAKLISESLFVNCAFSSERSSIYIHRSLLLSAKFESPIDSTIILRHCSVSDFSAWGYKGKLSIKAYRSVFNDCLLPTGEFTLDITNCVFAKCDLDRIVPSSRSRIKQTTFAETRCKGGDLSKLQEFDIENIALLQANARTIHPGDIRPNAWPDYDPYYEDDDEIPF